MSKKEKEVMKYEKPAITPVNEKPGFYLGLDDLVVYKGKKNAMQEIGKHRIFTGKFYSNAQRAIELVVLNQSGMSVKETYDKKVIAEFWKNVHFDKKANAFIYDEYLTIGTRKPAKPCQMEQYNKGKYEMFLIHHEIQALKTDLVTDAVVPVIKEAI